MKPRNAADQLTEHTSGPWYWNAGRHDGPQDKREPRTLCSRSIKSKVDKTDLHVLIPAACLPRDVAPFVSSIRLEIHASEADEKLIAASPDLLESLKMMVGVCEGYPDIAKYPDVRACLDEAIKTIYGATI